MRDFNVTINGYDDNVYIDITETSRGSLQAVLYRGDGNTEYEVEIFNHTASSLELLGKVIDGWAMSRKD